MSVAASLYRRGVGVIRIPTTLIGQVDAAIGVKGAINHAGKKNSLGVYLPPRLVLIDTGFLATLDAGSIRSGLAEILKMGIIRDAELFKMTAFNACRLLASRFQDSHAESNEIVRRAGVSMLDELEPNLYEDRTYRRLVDFGHTVSPALEAASGFNLRHGEAVAIDTALSAVLAVELGLISCVERDAIVDALLECGLPVCSPYLTLRLVRESMHEATRHRGGFTNFVVPTGIGSGAFVEDEGVFSDALVQHAVSLLQRRAAA